MTIHQIQTYTGRMVDPFNLAPDDICLEDIAHALSNLCRFGGHTSGFYSVAQHSVYASRLSPPPFRAWALLHDASEAYLHDISTPIKARPELAAYREAECRAQKSIAIRFDIPHSHLGIVKKVDAELLHFEANWLLNAPWADRILAEKVNQDFEQEHSVFGDGRSCWDPEAAKVVFLDEAYGLGLR